MQTFIFKDTFLDKIDGSQFLKKQGETLILMKGEILIFKLLKTRSFVFLRILTGKKHRQIKLQRLQKVHILAFGSLVHQINSL